MYSKIKDSSGFLMGTYKMALNHTKRMGMEKHIPPLEKGDEGGFFE
jgi:hypothetical protein